MFINVTTTEVMEIVALILQMYLFRCLGLKYSLVLAQFLALVGVVLLWIFGERTQIMVPISIGMMTFGLGACFGLVYASNLIFPVPNAS